MEAEVATKMWVASFIQTKHLMIEHLMIEVCESKLAAHQKIVTAQLETMQNNVHNTIKQLEMKLNRLTGVSESDTRLQENVEDLPSKVLESPEELPDGWGLWSDTNQWEVLRGTAATEQGLSGSATLQTDLQPEDETSPIRKRMLYSFVSQGQSEPKLATKDVQTETGRGAAVQTLLGIDASSQTGLDDEATAEAPSAADADVIGVGFWRARPDDEDSVKKAKKDYSSLKDAILKTLSSIGVQRTVTSEMKPVTNLPIKTMAVADLLERLKQECEGQPVAEDVCLLVNFFGWHEDGHVDVKLLSEVCKGVGHLHLLGMPKIDEAMRIEEKPKHRDWFPTTWSCLNGIAQLDSKLYQVFGKDCIRLLNAEFLRRHEMPLKEISKRQDIEDLIAKKQLPKDVYMSKEDVITILKEGRRGIGVLSYGWGGNGHCDPHGNVLSNVVRSLNESQLQHVKAVFWDCPCLYQWPRDLRQEEMFQEGLQVMGDLYASSLCTTVMRHKEIPKEPTENLSGLVVFSRQGIDAISKTEEELIRAVCHELNMEWDQRELEKKTLEFIDDERFFHKFSTHSSAEKAIKQMTGRPELRGLKASLVYNSVDYDMRGWTTFESAVSEEIISRVMHYGYLWPLLQSLPAKMLEIGKDPPKKVDEIKPIQESLLKPIVSHRTSAIESPYSRTRFWETRMRDSHFTNSSDVDMVCNLYRTYVKKVNLAAKSDTKPLSFYLGGKNAQGLPHGCGWELDTEGSVYRGGFQNGKRDGTGILRFSNGEVFQGSWKAGERCRIGHIWGSLATSTTGKVKIFRNEYNRDRREVDPAKSANLRMYERFACKRLHDLCNFFNIKEAKAIMVTSCKLDEALCLWNFFLLNFSRPAGHKVEIHVLVIGIEDLAAGQALVGHIFEEAKTYAKSKRNNPLPVDVDMKVNVAGGPSDAVRHEAFTFAPYHDQRSGFPQARKADLKYLQQDAEAKKAHFVGVMCRFPSYDLHMLDYIVPRQGGVLALRFGSNTRLLGGKEQQKEVWKDLTKKVHDAGARMVFIGNSFSFAKGATGMGIVDTTSAAFVTTLKKQSRKLWEHLFEAGGKVSWMYSCDQMAKWIVGEEPGFFQPPAVFQKRLQAFREALDLGQSDDREDIRNQLKTIIHDGAIGVEKVLATCRYLHRAAEEMWGAENAEHLRHAMMHLEKFGHSVEVEAAQHFAALFQSNKCVLQPVKLRWREPIGWEPEVIRGDHDGVLWAAKDVDVMQSIAWIGLGLNVPLAYRLVTGPAASHMAPTLPLPGASGATMLEPKGS